MQLRRLLWLEIQSSRVRSVMDYSSLKTVQFEPTSQRVLIQIQTQITSLILQQLVIVQRLLAVKSSSFRNTLLSVLTLIQPL